MLGIFGKRALDLAVLFFALYAFAFVPLGRHTGLEHLKRILATTAARSAGHDIVEAGDRLRERLLDGDAPSPSAHGSPVVPRLPRERPLPNAALAPANEHANAPDASL